MPIKSEDDGANAGIFETFNVLATREQENRPPNEDRIRGIIDG